MIIVDQEARDAILYETGSIVISASAGSGKTTIMIKKLKKVLEDLKNHKTVAAITFTTKATEEIKKKANLEGVKKEFFAQTNDSFVEYEIIRPFITDTYGPEFQSDFTIDYDFKFHDFESGKISLVEQGKLGVFNDIKENFKFRLALDILKNNIAARQYLQSKYEMLFLDEYQDSDLDMHELFMYLKEVLGIKLFIVGDPKQAIYIWRGAQPNIFEKLDSDDFKHYELVMNFRSHDEIVNYANLLHNTKYFNNQYSEKVERVVHCKLKDFTSSFSRLVYEGEIDLDKEITIIINYNDDARECAERLNEQGYNFQFIPRTPIDDNTPNNHLLYQLVCYVIDNNFSIYDLIENINVDSRRQMVRRVEVIIKKLKGNLECDQETFCSTLIDLEKLLEIKFTKDEMNLLYETVKEDKYHIAFKKTEDKHKVMTVFGSKGLEFSQVISFSRFYRVHIGQGYQNHYVCITRAKDKFIMVDDSNSYEEHIVSHSYRLGMRKTYNLFKSVDMLSE